MTLDDCTLNSQQKTDANMRALVLQYIEAHNAKHYAKAEELLHKINTMRKLT